MNLHSLLYRGDYYEIAYEPISGLILGVLLIPEPGHRGEPLDFHDLPMQLQQRITDSINPKPDCENEDDYPPHS